MTNGTHDRSVEQPASVPTATPALTPQGRLLAALVLVLGIVMGAPHSIFSALSVVALIVLLAVVVQARLGKILLGSMIVLPVAGTISLFFPLRFVTEWSITDVLDAYGALWPQMLSLIATPWLCVLVMMLLVETTPGADLLYALDRLRLPRVLVLLLSFMYRYVAVMRSQLTAARRALVSRAPRLSARRQVLLYGNLAGAMIIRAYDRGERIHAAMLSRGFTGTLPRACSVRMGAKDALLIACALLFSVALYLVA